MLDLLMEDQEEHKIETITTKQESESSIYYQHAETQIILFIGKYSYWTIDIHKKLDRK